MNSENKVEVTPSSGNIANALVSRRVVCQIEENLCRCRKTAICEMMVTTGTYGNIHVPVIVCKEHMDKFNPYVGNYVKRHLNRRRSHGG